MQLSRGRYRPVTKRQALPLPSLHGANAIQMWLAKVVNMLIKRIDHKVAALTLYALQTASANLQKTSSHTAPQSLQ